jgi:hypothetical protein
VPPVAVNAVETADPRTISPEVPELPTLRIEFKIVIDNGAVLALLPVCWSWTVMIMLVAIPAVVGTPLIWPEPEMVRPAGRFVADQV